MAPVLLPGLWGRAVAVATPARGSAGAPRWALPTPGDAHPGSVGGKREKETLVEGERSGSCWEEERDRQGLFLKH